MAKRNDKGELQKKPYGAWVFKAFGLLAKMKGLRGTPFDIFGHTEERRSERELIVEYRETVAGLLATLSKGNIDTAVAIASIPEEIRGYGHVKERHLKAAREKRALLLRSFGGAAALAQAA